MPWQRRSVLGSALAAGGLAANGLQAQEARYIKIATGSVTGTYYPVGSLIANLLSRPPGARACDEVGGCGVPNLILVVEASKGSVVNVTAIAAGRVETGFAQSDVTHGAFSGTGVHPDEIACIAPCRLRTWSSGSWTSVPAAWPTLTWRP